MSRRNIATNQTASEAGCCNPERVALTDRVKSTGEMLEKALFIATDIEHVLFGDEATGDGRPEAKCLEEEIEINERGMNFLLMKLEAIRVRLY